jgi:HEAT repeat protein
MALDWESFEKALGDELHGALAALGQSHPTQVFYAVALHGVYAELDGLLSLPQLGANTVEAGAPPDGSFWGARFNPGDWEHAELPLDQDRALALERALTEEACRDTPEHWADTHEKYLRVLVRLAARLRDAAPTLLPVSPDFVAFIHDEAQVELARETIAPEHFNALFPVTAGAARQRAELAEKPPTERVQQLVAALGSFGEGVTSEFAQAELAQLGAVAVPALLSLLQHPKRRWLAAKLLGEIGCATPEVIQALRPHAAKELWAPVALGMLGDDTWLMEQPPAVAIGGLTALLKAISTNVRCPPLSYAALEQYLDRAGQPAILLAEDDLAPGSSYRSIQPDDLNEALRALASPHAVIRWHACSLLGDRALGKTAGTLILPALAARLTDPHPIVRRLAVLSLSYWKSAAKPHRPAIQALAQDPDETVRKIVAHVLQ